MILQVGVKALLKNKKGEYLLLKRSLEKYPDVGNLWDIPGGRINPGTPLLDNLAREIKEETGLDLTSTPTLIAAQDILKVVDKHIVRLTYTAEIEGDPALNGEEHQEFRWISLEDLKSLTGLDRYTKELIEKF
ncbi:MAG: NUDIX hydrolase [Candidatus Daviesbacteria bacterium]|nr:NUDIX hydrolase [Candidatus Daviesbacteria bacterium]